MMEGPAEGYYSPNTRTRVRSLIYKANYGRLKWSSVKFNAEGTGSFVWEPVELEIFFCLRC